MTGSGGLLGLEDTLCGHRSGADHGIRPSAHTLEIFSLDPVVQYHAGALVIVRYEKMPDILDGHRLNLNLFVFGEFRGLKVDGQLLLLTLAKSICRRITVG
ncbi:MAG: hypothetical protein INR62_12245 [Rhodospirillales bacterium]|nr:hypothetical protein [Acetobacter sp.]